MCLSHDIRIATGIFLGASLFTLCGAVSLIGADVTYLEGHEEAIRDLAVTHDGEWLVSVGDDGRLIVRPTDDVQQKTVAQPREGGLMCLAFSKDGQHVYDAGNLADFGRTKDVDGAIRVSLKNGKADGFIEFPVTGTIRRMAIVNEDTRVIYFSASYELLTLDIGAKVFASKKRIYGGYMGFAVISPASKHFAVKSQNEQNRRPVAPYRLTAFSRNNRQTLSYEFPSQKEYDGAVMCFPNEEQLVLIGPTGKIQKWKYAVDRERWEAQEALQATVNGPFTAIVSSSDTGTIWLARGRTLLGIEARTGQGCQETDLQVGKRTGNISANLIECLAILGKQSLVVAGLQDGRLALVPIDQIAK